MKKIVKYLRKSLFFIFPVLTNKIMYLILMKKLLNLNDPKTFNEKINWLKIFDYPNNKLVIQCSDKYLVRNYVKSKGLEEILNDLYFVYDEVENIKWELLPKSFVLKCNHGCGYNIICSNKDNLERKKTLKKLKRWINEDFGVVSGERHYSKIDKKIICEKYLGENILDYKFFCFNGKPEFLYISRAVNGSHHGLKADFFDINGGKMPFRRTDHDSFDIAPKMIKNMDYALKICSKLSEDFSFVRVDLFEVNNKIYFSELTFSPCSGMMPFDPIEYDFEIGKKIKINNY